MNRADAQRAHAIHRARLPERGAVALTHEDYAWLTNCIRRQHQTRKRGKSPAKFLERISQRLTVWAIVLPGGMLRAVYDNKRGRIATFLPLVDSEDYLLRKARLAELEEIENDN